MKRLLCYLAITFALTWGLWIPLGMYTGSFQNGIASSTLMMGFVALGMFFPLVGALAANALVPPDERIDLRMRPLIRQNVRWYLVAWLAPALLTVLGTALFFVLNPQLFDPSASALADMMEASGADKSQAAPALGAIVLAAVVVAPFINAVPAFGEEVGWRGMLFPSLCERMSPRRAVLVSGVIWGLWHAPIIAMGHNYGTDYAGYPVVGILVMVVACTCLGCLLACLRLVTGSVWPCALAHGAVNAIANVGVYFCVAGQTILGPSPLGAVGCIPTAIIALLCWLRLPTSQEAPRASHAAASDERG